VTALLVVDLQNDFLPGGALAVPGGDEVIPVIRRAMEILPIVVASRDWHPADHGSFAANHPGRSPGERIILDGLEQILWPVHCVQGTPGAAFAAGIDASRFDHVVSKGEDPRVDSYSAFFDNARRHATGLEDWLRDRRIEELVVCGLATDYCVRASALDAVELGFKTSLLVDGVRGVDLEPGDVDRAIDEMRRAGVEILSLRDLEARADRTSEREETR